MAVQAGFRTRHIMTAAITVIKRMKKFKLLDETREELVGHSTNPGEVVVEVDQQELGVLFQFPLELLSLGLKVMTMMMMMTMMTKMMKMMNER